MRWPGRTASEVSEVSVVPAGTVDDQRRMVAYDSGHTDPIVVHVDNSSFKGAEGGSEATLSSPSRDNRSWKGKKDKKK